MRIRSICPEFWRDQRVQAWPMEARLLFIGLWSAADDAGRFQADPDMLKGDLFPKDSPRVFAAAWDVVTGSARVLTWESDGARYGVIVHWAVYQKIDSAQPSSLPCPPDEIAEGIIRTCRGNQRWREVFELRIARMFADGSPTIRRMFDECSATVRQSFDDDSRSRARARLEQGAGRREEGAGDRGGSTASAAAGDGGTGEDPGWRERVRLVRSAHPEFEAVPEMALLNILRSFPLADVREAVESLGRDWAGRSFCGAVTPQKELRKYLGHSQEAKKKTAGVGGAPGVAKVQVFEGVG
jgi:hypothetical protein